MNRVRLVLVGERIPRAAAAEVIVVRADRDPRLADSRHRRACGQVRHHVVAGLLLADDPGVDRDHQTGNREARDMRIAAVELLLHVLQILSGRRKDRSGRLAAEADRDDAGTGNRRVETHRHDAAGIRRPRTGHDNHALRAALPRRLRLVAKIGVARQDAARLLIGIFGKVAEHDDDLVFHIQPGVAVVTEILRIGNDEAVAGKHHVADRLAVVGKRQRGDVGAGKLPGLVAVIGNPRTAVFRSGGERERHPEVGHPRQRPRAHLFQLGDKVIRGQLLSRRPGQSPFHSR
jgi:hypothetical protein